MGNYFLKVSVCVLLFLSFIFSEPRKVVFSTVSTTPSKDRYSYTPLINYLNHTLPQYHFVFSIAESVDEMIKGIQKKEVDFYVDSALTSVVVNHHSNSKMLLKRWKNGISKTNSVFFVNEDSPIKNIKDLKRKKVAFSSPHSTTGYMLPKAELERSGLKTAAVKDDEKFDGVGYVFSNFSPSSITLVKKKHVDAGVMSEDQFHQFSNNKDGVRVIHQTSVRLPPHIVNVGSHVPKDVIEDVQKTLIDMSENSKGKIALESFEGTKLIDKLTKEELKEVDQFRQQVVHWK